LRTKPDVFVLTGIVLTLVCAPGCSVNRRSVERSSAVDVRSNVSDELEFWDSVSARPLVTNHDALHGLLLLAGEQPGSFKDRLSLARLRGWVDGDEVILANEAARVGLISVACCDLLKIKGGVTRLLFGTSERYCTRELVYRRSLPARSPNQALSGLEFADLMSRVSAELRANRPPAAADFSVERKRLESPAVDAPLDPAAGGSSGLIQPSPATPEEPATAPVTPGESANKTKAAPTTPEATLGAPKATQPTEREADQPAEPEVEQPAGPKAATSEALPASKPEASVAGSPKAAVESPEAKPDGPPSAKADPRTKIRAARAERAKRQLEALKAGRPQAIAEDRVKVLQAAVLQVEGRAQWKPAGRRARWRVAKVDDLLDPGARIRTGRGAAMVLRVGFNATIVVDANTRMVLPEVVQRGKTLKTAVKLSRGRADFKIDKVGLDNDFSVVTPSTLLSVRGTGYLVQFGSLFGTEVFLSKRDALSAVELNYFMKRATYDLSVGSSSTDENKDPAVKALFDTFGPPPVSNLSRSDPATVGFMLAKLGDGPPPLRDLVVDGTKALRRIDVGVQSDQRVDAMVADNDLVSPLDDKEGENPNEGGDDSGGTITLPPPSIGEP